MVKQNWKNSICVFFKRGFCKNGASCSFSHDKSSGDNTLIPTCKNWINGTCKFGTNCMFSHETRNIDDALAIHNARVLNEAAQATYFTSNPLYDYSELPGMSTYSPGQNSTFIPCFNPQQASYPPQQQTYSSSAYPAYSQFTYHPQHQINPSQLNNTPVKLEPILASKKDKLQNQTAIRGVENVVDASSERPLKRQRLEL